MAWMGFKFAICTGVVNVSLFDWMSYKLEQVRGLPVQFLLSNQLVCFPAFSMDKYSTMYPNKEDNVV